MRGIARWAAAIAAVFLLGAGPADDGRWLAGGYSFSDERGGFRIRAIDGSGTRDDPVVLTQELYSASSVVLVIREVARPPPQPGAVHYAGTRLYLKLETVNASGLAWIEFAYELQEKPGLPSTYGDGLSFDQRRTQGDAVSSDAFSAHKRDFEPHDRLLFSKGKSDPGEMASFSFLVTDLTPVATFYLVQDPRIPFS
ncbi:hypothetical protein [Chelativorans salis]|uniref:Uncharacterized protein n=1 Tax=Chelativorans salis TaxID=2978478 RepID=A0ABT2LN84_9HYPH|nr:hypothetical protein [Chelativorans sp. EGI FJ00035]MCT7376035.1 hypothetical protein [Chelativorans sp. EGI FJ00035]